MSERLASVQRSIAREEALRASGADPDPFTVERTLDFICSDPGLLADEGARRYLLDRSDTLHYHIATKILDLVVPLHDLGFEEEAVRCLRRLLRAHDPAVWDPNGTGLYRFLANKAFQEVLGHDRLSADQTGMWGILAVDIFSALLAAPWKASRWSVGVGAGERDRYPPGWLSEKPWEGEDARRLAGHVVCEALKRAALQSSGETFRALSDRLQQIPYTIVLDLILRTFCDALGEGGPQWLVSEAARFLTLEGVAGTEATYESRRMLRRALPPESIPREDRLAILQSIRAGQVDEFRRWNELADLEKWEILSADEVRHIEGERSSGHLFPPRDPREQSMVFRAERPEPEDWQTAAFRRWPYSDEHALLFMLQQRESSQTKYEPGSFEEDLGPRLRALRMILDHPEAIGDEWLGTTLSYCTRAIEDLIAWFRRSKNHGKENRPLSLADGRSLYESHAPWWEIIAGAAVSRLRGPVPPAHDTSKVEMLMWGSGDPIYESLRFLDEILIVESGEPFDGIRRNLESAFSDVWVHWPRYTRATTLAVLRPYHWGPISGLARWIEHTLNSEEDAHVLKWCLQTLLLSSNSIAARLSGLIERVAPFSNIEDLARSIGEVLADAVIRARGDREGWAELEAVADLADLIMARTGWHDEFRADIASGMMWGASKRLAQTDQLTDQHALCWLSLARKSLILWLEGANASGDDRIPLIPVMLVLERNWTDRERYKLLVGLSDLLERIFREGSIASFFDAHHHLSRQIDGVGKKPRPIPDEILTRLCHASSTRIAEWAAGRTTTNDLGFAGTVYGRETAELIRLAFRHAKDRDMVRRELAPCIDRLHEAGRLDLATELRITLRRG